MSLSEIFWLSKELLIEATVIYNAEEYFFLFPLNLSCGNFFYFPFIVATINIKLALQCYKIFSQSRLVYPLLWASVFESV